MQASMLNTIIHQNKKAKHFYFFWKVLPALTVFLKAS